MSEQSNASAFPESVQPGIPRLPQRPPVGWSRTPLKFDLYEEKRPVEMIDDREYDLVTVKRGRGGVIKRERKRGADISVKAQFEVKRGDFLISKRQIVHGACGLVPPALDGSTVSNEYAVLRSRGAIDLEFLKYLSHSIYFQQTCFHSSIGVHIEKMIFKTERWLGWEFDMPPLEEQRRIAEILSTWDRAIEVTETLVAKSQAQKKALMQQLLSGKRRLPGFDGQWQAKDLKDIAGVIVSNVDKKSVEGETRVRLCNYTDVYSRDKIENDQEFMSATASASQIARFALRVDDVVITKDSETPSDIAVSTVIASTSPDLICGYHLAILRPKIGYSGRFMHYQLQTPRVRNYFASHANGATRFGLTLQGIEEAPLKLPSLKEQLQIADVLDCASIELRSLLRSLAKLKIQKSALMQQVLSGKRRVLYEREGVRA